MLNKKWFAVICPLLLLSSRTLPSYRSLYRSSPLLIALMVALSSLPVRLLALEELSYEIPGLEAKAEILVDQWGVPHIYANTHYDVFFVQGFNAARDRLWQIDLWRKRGLGQLSEVLGPAFVEQDRAARLFLYRGDMYAEWLAYGSDAKRIAQSFTAGINAYIQLIKEQPELLPLEFEILGYEPHEWQAQDPLLIRSNGLWRNLVTEVLRARVLCQHGKTVDALRKKLEPPWEVNVPDGLDPCDIPSDVLQLYSLAKAPVDFSQALQFADQKPKEMAMNAMELMENRDFDAGSNNWVIAPSKTASGKAMIANDPHRGHAVPSLRYLAHLKGPGIDVIGAGEPALPGISIGHNQNIAFGLTTFAIDQEDLMVYETKKRLRYRYQDAWETMEVVKEVIRVAGGDSVPLELLFTRHGPVIYEDKGNRKAFAAKAAWLEPGMAPYFGSVEYMRAENWREFLAALNRWGAPAENQVYADRQGNIGYKPAGLMPVRRNHDGLLPVPGDGRYEWDGYYDMDQLPVEYNPSRGWIATANAMNLPEDYPYKTIKPGFEWSAPWRSRRIEEVLTNSDGHTIKDSLELQRDYLSIPARRILGAVDAKALPSPASALFSGWDYRLERDSAAAALFEIWFRRYLMPAVISHITGLETLEDLGGLDSLVVVESFESLPADVRKTLAGNTLTKAIAEATRQMGDNLDSWNWGSIHKIRFKHPLYEFVDDQMQRLLSLPVMARGGSSDTPNNTGYRKGYDVVSGASWRMVIDLAEWDSARMTSAPGQSGDPRSPHYDNLLENWANDGSLPLLYSRDRVEDNLSIHIKLTPARP